METLNTAEARAATTNLGQANTALTTSEENPSFVSSVAGRNAKAKGKGFLRGKGPIGLIIALVFGGGGFMFLSQSLAPFSFINNIMDQYNVTRTIMNRRSNYMMRLQMDPTRNKTITSTSIFSNEKFKIPKSMREKLARNNIDYVETEDADGKKLKLLLYTDPSTNEKIAIVANDNDAARVPFSLDINGENVPLTKVQQLDVAIDETPNFSKSLDLSTRTLKGHIAGWFTGISETFHTRIQNSRNTFANLPEGASDEEVVAAAKNKGLTTDVDGTGKKEYTELNEEEVEGEDGKPKVITTETPEVEDGNDSIKAKSTTTEVEGALSTRVKKAAASAGGITCAVANGLSAINKVTSAIMIAQVINFGTKVFEAIQKTQAGDGGAAMMYFMNGLNEKGDTTGLNEKGEEYMAEQGVTSMSSPAWNATFGGQDLSADDPIAKKYNQEYMTTFALTHAGLAGEFASWISAIATSREVYAACNAYRGVMSTVSLVSTLFPPAKAVAEVGKKVYEIVINIAVGALGFVIAVAAPRIAKSIPIDLVESMSGSDAAYALRAAGNRYMGGQTEANTGGPGTYDEVVAMYKETQSVIAEEAEFERSIKSPFDITSQNTFLGSLIYSLLPLGNSLNAGSTISAAPILASITKKSVIALMPTVSAASDEVDFKLSLNRDCPSLTSLDENLVADAFCTPYYSMDMSTMIMDPADIYMQIADNFEGEDENGNPKIKKGSDFSNWIIACTQRDSVWGTVDQKIQTGLTTYTTVPSTGNADADALINTAANYVPVLDDIADIAQVTDQFINYKWNTGEACLGGDSKYFAQYTVDQNILETESNGEIKSSVATVLDDYYIENPLDTSYEGIIARYSGMSTEDVKDTLALIEYYNYIANYNPTERHQFAPVDDIEKTIYVEDSDTTTLAILPRVIVFADTRNRFFAIS